MHTLFARGKTAKLVIAGAVVTLITTAAYTAHADGAPAEPTKPTPAPTAAPNPTPDAGKTHKAKKDNFGQQVRLVRACERLQRWAAKPVAGKNNKATKARTSHGPVAELIKLSGSTANVKAYCEQLSKKVCATWSARGKDKAAKAKCPFALDRKAVKGKADNAKGDGKGKAACDKTGKPDRGKATKAASEDSTDTDKAETTDKAAVKDAVTKLCDTDKAAGAGKRGGDRVKDRLCSNVATDKATS